ncbi:[trimethylamine--corrinoid protein] Co-methyltransferase, partial [Candidatus Bathyarchaeota archaeon]|nr:[trimethylamine--corrinoid protein] Co-methyltransferase [Candidatus Bathyarchaeota archaeon]
MVDPQAAHEKTITTLIPAMVTKGKSMYGMGMLDSGMSMSLEQYVIDNEIVAAVRHSLKGIEVTDETIDLDTIMKVGPGG